MTIAAFDAKQFRRGKIINIQEGTTSTVKYLGFNSQLGVGVIFGDDRKFLEKYISKNEELSESFGIQEKLPFYSSTHLKQLIGLRKAIAFTDQLITEVQNNIDFIHCSYVILPPKKIKTVSVGGFKSSSTEIPTNKFIDNLGPMFSYLTLQSYLFTKNFANISDVKFYIDAFRSKYTLAWENITKYTSPRIYLRGDECNPFISCADIIAFLTDVKLYDQRLRLEPNDIRKAWNAYSFKTDVRFFDEKSLYVYSWKTDELINYLPFLVKPTVFLSVDDIEKPEYAEMLEESLTEQTGVKDERVVRKFHQVIKRSDVYYSAIKYAYHKKGSMKIFSRTEDIEMIKDGDIFVYVGSNSKKVGEAFRDAYDIELLSGLQLRQKIKEVL